MYTAPWCSVCARVAPLVADVAQRYRGVDLRMIDVDDPGNQPVPVKGVPTVTVVLGNGTVIGRKTGSITEAEVEQLFEAATTARPIRGAVDSTTRSIRIGAGAALVALGIVSAAPVLIGLGAGAAVWGTYDLLPMRSA